MPNCVFYCSLVERLRGNAYITTSDLIRQNLKVNDGMRKRPDNNRNGKAAKDKRPDVELVFFDDFFIYKNMAARRPL